MNKKDLGLLALIVVVGFVVYLRNPAFLGPQNLANTANLMMEDATSNDADTNLANGL